MLQSTFMNMYTIFWNTCGYVKLYFIRWKFTYIIKNL